MRKKYSPMRKQQASSLKRRLLAVARMNTIVEDVKGLYQTDDEETKEIVDSITGRVNTPQYEVFTGKLYSISLVPDREGIGYLAENPSVPYVNERTRKYFWNVYLSQFANREYMDYIIFVPQHDKKTIDNLDKILSGVRLENEMKDEPLNLTPMQLALLENVANAQTTRRRLVEAIEHYRIDYAPPADERFGIFQKPAKRRQQFQYSRLTDDYILRLLDYTCISNLQTNEVKYEYKQYFSNKCALEYIYHKLNIPLNEQLGYFKSKGIDVNEGVLSRDYIAYLDSLNISFYILGFDMVVIYVKNTKETPGKRETKVFLYFANNHVYAIENIELQDMIKYKKVGDKIDLTPNLRLFNYNDLQEDNIRIIKSPSLNDYILENYQNNNLIPLVSRFNGPKCVYVMDDNKHIIANVDYDSVKKYCEEFDIKFENQSLPKLCVQIVESKYKKLPYPACFTVSEMEKFNNGILIPCHQLMEGSLNRQAAGEDTEARRDNKAEGPRAAERHSEEDVADLAKYLYLDISRFYTSCLYKRNEPYPVPYFDNWQSGPPKEILAGRYRLSCSVLLCNGKVQIPAKYTIDNYLLKYLIGKKRVKLSDVSEHLIASRFVPPEYFQNMVKYFYTKHDKSSIIKEIFNNLIGYFGIIRTNQTNAYFTTEYSSYWDFAILHKNLGGKPTHTALGKNKEGKPLLLCHVDQKKYKLKNHRPLWQGVIDTSYVILDEYVEHLAKNYSMVSLVGIKTDCLIVKCKKEEETDFDKKPKNPDLNTIGNIFVEKETSTLDFSHPRPSIGNQMVNYQHNDEFVLRLTTDIPSIIKENNGFVLQGPSGTGKTYITKNTIIPELVSSGKTYKVLTISHLAGNNYDDYSTFASFFPEGTVQSNRYDYIIVDEYSNVSMNYYEKLYFYQQKFDCAIILIGDLNQCQPIEENDDVRDYNQLNLIKQLTDFNIIRLTTIQRYDQKLFDVSQDLINKGILSGVQVIDEARYLQIVNYNDVAIGYTNRKRTEINDKLKLKYNDQINDGKMAAPLICKTNTKDFNNGQLMYRLNIIDKSGKKSVKYFDYYNLNDLNPQPQLYDEKTKTGVKLEDAYMLTSHSSQGQTFSNQVFVFEADIMDKNILYTAITRATRYEKLFVVGGIRAKYSTRRYEKEPQACIYTKTGTVYKLFNDKNQCIYVGITEKKDGLESRLEDHKADKPFAMHTFNTFEYYNLSELLEEELRVISYELTQGSPLLNKQKVKDYEDAKTRHAKLKKALTEVSLVPRLPYVITTKSDCVAIYVNGELVRRVRITKTLPEKEALQLAMDKAKRLVNEDPDIKAKIELNFK